MLKTAIFPLNKRYDEAMHWRKIVVAFSLGMETPFQQMIIIQKQLKASKCLYFTFKKYTFKKFTFKSILMTKFQKCVQQTACKMFSYRQEKTVSVCSCNAHVIYLDGD